MKVTLAFVPPGGGETDYQLDMEVPELPRPGDYISVRREDAESFGREDFIVRRVWWDTTYPSSAEYATGDNVPIGRTAHVIIECEFALSPFSSESHKRACEMYRHRGKPLKDYDNTAY